MSLLLLAAWLLLLALTALLAWLGWKRRLGSASGAAFGLLAAALVLEVALGMAWIWHKAPLLAQNQTEERYKMEEDFARLQIWTQPGYQGERTAFANNVFHLWAPTASLKLNYPGWVVFYDRDNMNSEASFLWVKGPAEIPDLSKLKRSAKVGANCRPQGTWNGVIRSFAFVGNLEPKGDCITRLP